MFLNGVESDIKDPQSRNKCRPNLPPKENQALKDLIKLQKDREIVIKPCDMGAGIIILNFNDYMTSCYTHLQSKQKQLDGTSLPYYEKVSDKDFTNAKKDIIKILDEALENEDITKQEYEAMNPTGKNPATQFYELFK